MQNISSGFFLFEENTKLSTIKTSLFDIGNSTNVSFSDLSNNQIRIRSNGTTGHHEKFKDLLVLIEWENEDEDGMIVKHYIHGTDGDSAAFSGHWNAGVNTQSE